ncbi:MAG TPA: tetratricopeptide repeat protein [Edaphobacter sp.]|nr:tetratricopeptide repeat protein [Edaphobacter sp.]
MKPPIKEPVLSRPHKHLKRLMPLLGLWAYVPLALTQTLAGTGSSEPRVGTSTQYGLNDARHLTAIGEFSKAEILLRSYLKTEERSGSARFLLAYVLLRLNKPKESLAEYTHAAQLQKPSAEDLKNVALDYVLLEDYEDAEKWMRRSVQMNEKDPDAWYGLGRIFYTKQRFQDAVDCFKRTLALDPTSVKAEDNLGLAYEGLNRTEDAIQSYRAALALEQNSKESNQKPPSEQPMLNLAIILIHHGHTEEALPLLIKAASISPRDPRIREQLGHLYLQQGKLDEAQHEFEEAVALSPNSSALHFLLGQVYRRRGLNDKAKTEFARAAELNGSHSTQTKD